MRNQRQTRISQELPEDPETVLLRSGNEDVRIVGTFTNNEHKGIQFNQKEDCFEYYDYIPPGIHNYKIYWIRNQESEPHQILKEGSISIKPRDAEIPMKLERKFDLPFVKERSAFADFKLEDENALNKAFELDVRKFRLKDLQIKKTEADKILMCLYQKYKILKSIFMHYAANTTFPTLSLDGFGDYLQEIKLYDNDFKRQDAVKMVLAMKEEDEANETPQNSLNRSEFIESLLRIALYKTKKAGDPQADIIGNFILVEIYNDDREIFKRTYYSFIFEHIEII